MNPLILVSLLASATPLPPAPPQGWCTDGSNNTGYYGVRNCPDQPPPVGTCPAGRMTVGDVAYLVSLSSASTVRGVDLTKAENIWGRVSPTDPIKPFPWTNYFAVLKGFDKRPGAYLAAQFTVPLTASPTIFGQFTHGETLPGPNLTMAISERCGDFSPETALCLRTNMGPGSLLTKYKLPAATGNSCPLVPGRTYFVNVKAATTSGPGCSATASYCPTTIQNNWTN